MRNKPIGFIGLGLLGTAMSDRLLADGYEVVGFDRDENRNREHASRGGLVAGSAQEVVERCEIALLSLPNSQIVRKVVTELESSLRPGMILVDTTTGAPEDSETLGAELGTHDINYLDATVAGSSVQARQGNVLILVGGRKPAFEGCQELFRTLGRETFYCGPWGSGARMKLVVNLVLGLNRAVLAEGLAFARQGGIDPAAALEILKAGPTYSRVMDTKGPKMISGEFALEARLAQHLKDVHLILDQGAKTGARLPFSALHAQLLQSLVERGLGDVDNSAIVRAFD